MITLSDFLASYLKYKHEREIIICTNKAKTESFYKVVPSYRAILADNGYVAAYKLGSGAYSDVHLCSRLNSKKQIEHFAVKVIDRRRATVEYQLRFLVREILIWSKLRHPNIVQMKSFFFGPQPCRYVFLVSNFIEGGDCLKFIQANGPLDEFSTRKWLIQLCSGVGYLHQQEIVHRDLKLENMLLDADGNLKIADFGFSTQMDSNLCKTFCGSKSYAAPEILLGQAHDPKKADVWAIGVITFVISTGLMPYNEHQVSNKLIVEQQKHVPVPPLSTPFLPNFYEFLSKALHFAPEFRYSLDSMLFIDQYLITFNSFFQCYSTRTSKSQLDDLLLRSMLSFTFYGVW